MNPETRLLSAIVKALRLHGHTVMRIQTGKVLAKRGKHEHWMQLAEPGTPDLHLPFVPCWLEVKLPSAIAPQSKLSDAQRRWHARALEAGVRVAVVRSAGEAIQQVEAWQRADRDVLTPGERAYIEETLRRLGRT